MTNAIIRKFKTAVRKTPILSVARLCRSSLGKAVIFLSVKCNKPLREINSACHKADYRHYYIVYKRINYRLKRAAYNNSYCKIKHIATQYKGFKFMHEPLAGLGVLLCVILSIFYK